MIKQIKFFSITTRSSVIEAISAINIEGVTMSSPIQLDGHNSNLAAPINPEDIVTGLEIIKLLFESATAGLAFFLALKNVLKSDATKIEVYADQKKVGEITKKTDNKDIERLIEQ